MANAIHPTAIIEPSVKLGEDVEVGPYCVLSGPVELGDRCVLKSHVAIEGHTSVGPDTTIFPFASIGTIPQDLKFGGEASRLVIGARNRIREHVTMNPGTSGGGMVTHVGDDGLFMVGVHIAHDCRIGNHVVLANNATIAGHVTVGDRVIIGGLSAVRQFVRIGDGAIIGGMTGIDNDVLPNAMVAGERGKLMGLNLVGLQRSGASRETIAALKAAYETLFGGDGTLAERIAAAEARFGAEPAVRAMIEFARVKSSLGLCQPRAG